MAPTDGDVADLKVTTKPVTPADVANSGQFNRDAFSARRLWVTPRQKEAIDRVRTKCAIYVARYQAAQPLVGWFENNRLAIERVLQPQLEQIRMQARRSLHQNGDAIHISVSALEAVDILSVTLHQTGPGFDPVRVVVRRAKQGGLHWYDFEGTLSGGILNLPRQLVANHAGIAESSLKAILRAVIIDALYQLVVVERTRTPPTRPTAARASPASILEGRPETAVTAHQRRLGPGQQASSSARDAARLVLGVELPPGVTFVCAHMRAGRLTPMETQGQLSPRVGTHPYTDTMLHLLVE